MSEAKHTPGPWRHEGPDMFGDFNILHPADSLAIAGVVTNLRQPGEVEANARLIAAAPDLLEALKAFLEFDGHDDFTDCWPAARAAIAKATGATP